MADRSYKAIAEEIVGYVGKDNVTTYTHCATRLRFVVKDQSKIDEAHLKAMQEVMGIVVKGGQYQVIIGPTVDKVYNEVMEIIPLGSQSNEKEADKEETGKKQSIGVSF